MLTLTVPPPPELAAAIERAAVLTQTIIDSTPWEVVWIPKPSVRIVRVHYAGRSYATQLQLGIPVVGDASRGVRPIDSPPVQWCAYDDGIPLPTTLAEAAQGVRAHLTGIADHELREVLRGPGGEYAFEPHPVERRSPSLTGDQRFSIDPI